MFDFVKNMQAIFEGITELQQQYVATGKLSKAIFDQFVAGDVTPTKKYVGWMVKKYVTSNDKQGKASIANLIAYTNWFEEYKNTKVITNKDIYQYSLEEIINAYNGMQVEVLYTKPDGTEVIYESENNPDRIKVTVLKIDNFRQSSAHGTYNWCLAREPMYWRIYNIERKNSVYFVHLDDVPRFAVLRNRNGYIHSYDLRNEEQYIPQVNDAVFNKWKIPQSLFKYTKPFKDMDKEDEVWFDKYDSSVVPIKSNDKYVLFYVQREQWDVPKEFYGIDIRLKCAGGAVLTGVYSKETKSYVPDAYVIMYQDNYDTVMYPTKKPMQADKWAELFGFSPEFIQSSSDDIDNDMLDEMQREVKERAHDESAKKLHDFFERIIAHGGYTCKEEYTQSDWDDLVLDDIDEVRLPLLPTLMEGEYKNKYRHLNADAISRKFDNGVTFVYGKENGYAEDPYRSRRVYVVQEVFYPDEVFLQPDGGYTCPVGWKEEDAVIILWNIGMLIFTGDNPEFEASRKLKDVDGQTYFNFIESRDAINKNLELLK